MSAILERNLTELLRRHRPVVADPAFRERLGARFVAAAMDAAAVPAAPPVERTTRTAPMWRAALLAAAGLLAVLGAWWVVQGGGAPRSPLDELLARADAASRELPEGEWSTAAGTRLALAERALEVAGAGRAEIAVDLPPALGEVALLAGAPARVTFEPEGEAVRVRVLEGRAELRRPGMSALPLGSGLLVGPRDSALLPAPTSDVPQPLGPDDEPRTAEAPPAPGEIHGRIVRPDGQPVTEALLTLASTGITSEGPKVSMRELQDPAGAFRWAPAPGRYHLFVQVPGHATHATRNITVASDLLLPELVIQPEIGITVSGTVLDTAGAPVAGALILSDSDAPSIMLPLDPAHLAEEEGRGLLAVHARSDEQGRFELPHLSSGGQVLRVSAPGLAPAWLPLPAGPVADASIKLSVAGAVEGRVLREDGRAWAGAFMVASFNPPQPDARCMVFGLGITDAEGRYRIESLPPLMGVVLALGDPPSPGLPPMRALRIEAGGTVTADFGEPRAASGPAGELRGFLTEPDGTPAIGRVLSLAPMGGDHMSDWTGSMVDDRGAYLFGDLAGGSYDLYAAFGTAGEVSFLARVELREGESQRLDLRLPAGGLSGRATEPDGTALFGANVIMFTERPEGWVFAARALSDEHGDWTAYGLGPGTYRAIVYDVRDRAAAVRLDGLRVGTALVGGLDTLHMPGGYVLVRVHGADGAPRAGVVPRFHDAQGVEWEFGMEMATGAEGVVRVGGVPPGLWRVTADGVASAELDVRAEQTVEVTITLPAGG